jgi:dihydrofolate reductase
MGKVIVIQTVTTDGYGAGSNQAEKRPFGEDGGDGWGNRLHAWMFEQAEENQAELDQMAGVQAHIMGRNMFGPVRGEWDRNWNGWWGDDPPFHGPVFVLTHYPRDPQPMEGGTTTTSSPTESSRHWPEHVRRPGTATSRSRVVRTPSTST